MMFGFAGKMLYIILGLIFMTAIISGIIIFETYFVPHERNTENSGNFQTFKNESGQTCWRDLDKKTGIGSITCTDLEGEIKK